MRENSGLWIALIVGGGLLLAGLAGLGGLAVMRQQSAQREAAAKQREAEQARADAEAKLADLNRRKPKTAPASPDEPGPEPAPPAESSTAERWNNAAFREYATDLHKNYQGNAIAADNKYKGKLVGVIGEVNVIDTPGGKPLVILKAGEFEFAEMVMCYCDDTERGKLGTLSGGHWVALVGTCTGKESLGGLQIGGGVTLKGCRVVHVAPDKESMKKAYKQNS